MQRQKQKPRQVNEKQMFASVMKAIYSVSEEQRAWFSGGKSVYVAFNFFFFGGEASSITRTAFSSPSTVEGLVMLFFYVYAKWTEQGAEKKTLPHPSPNLEYALGKFYVWKSERKFFSDHNSVGGGRARCLMHSSCSCFVWGWTETSWRASGE